MKYWILDRKEPDGIPESVDARSFDEAASIFAQISGNWRGPRWANISIRQLSEKNIKNCEIRDYTLNDDDEYVSNDPVDRPASTKKAPAKKAPASPKDYTLFDLCELFITEFEKDLVEVFETERGIHAQLVVHNSRVCVGTRIRDSIYIDVSKPLFDPDDFSQKDLKGLVEVLGLLDNESNRTRVRERLNKCGAISLHFTAFRLKIQRTIYVLINASSAEEAEEIATPVLKEGAFHLPVIEVPWTIEEVERLAEAHSTTSALKSGDFTLATLTDPDDDFDLGGE